MEGVANLEAFQLLWVIENGLRQLIINEMERSFGSRWYSQHLPGDILAKYKSGLAYDRNVRWLDHISHHPIYYLDFPDLGKIVLRADNWGKVFAPILHRREVIEQSLKQIEPVRNRLAHNRLCSCADVNELRHTQGVLDTLLGSEGALASLAAKTTALTTLRLSIENLRDQLLTTFGAMLQLLPASVDAGALAITRAWWFDPSYLGVDVAPIHRCIELVDAYTALRSRRSSGRATEKWLLLENVSSLRDACVLLLDQLLEEFR